MDAIWSQIPNDLAIHIIGFLDDIDTRLAFKIPPRKLKSGRKFDLRPEFIYDHLSRTLWDFSGLSETDHPYWITRKGIKFSQYRSPGLYVFNIGWEDYDMTMYSGESIHGPTVCRNHIVLNKKVKFK